MIVKEMHLVRWIGQRTNDETVLQQVGYILQRATSGTRGNGWVIGKPKLHEPTKDASGLWRFDCYVQITKGRSRGDAWIGQWNEILFAAQNAGRATRYGTYPWTVVAAGTPVNSPEKIEVAPEIETIVSESKGYAALCLERESHFDHIFDRQAQVEMLVASIKAAQESEMQNRFHCVLYGPPGCGKTEILRATASMLGNEGEAYIKFDATSTSKAGVEKLLLDPNTQIPPVLIIEEIEKTSEENLRWLLGILDQRGEIRKLNYRVNQSRSAPMLCLATVNDMDLFKRLMAGALASRFPNKLYCPRPSREADFGT